MNKFVNAGRLAKLVCAPNVLPKRFVIALFLLIGLLQINSATFGQGVTLKGKNITIESVFKAITKQTGYQVVLFTTRFKTSRQVDLDFNNSSLSDVFRLLLRDTDMIYLIDGKTIIIKENRQQPPGSITNETAGFTAHGRVKDAKGKPLPDATVFVKGKNRGEKTDRNGEFSITNLDRRDILVVSFTGYETVELSAGAYLQDIILPEKVAALNEVIVSNGYQNIDSRKLTSAITTIKAADIVSPGMFSIDQALEGRVPGLFVLNNSGDIGVSPKVRIRGTSTILGNREPVWVVDGVVVNDPVGIDPSTINDLDFVNRLGNAISGLKPYDIEQIDVLKDAAATALYGVRAANGVIVITTKKGKIGDPVISFNQSTNFTRRPRYSDHNINVMNSRERIDFSRDIISSGLNYPNNVNYVGYEGALNDLYKGNISYDQFQQRVHKMETMNTDWFGAILNDAISTQNNLSISGGTNKLRYYASIGAATQRSTVRGDFNNQFTTAVNLSATISPKVTWDMSLRGNTEKTDYVAASVNALSYAYNTSRAVPAYNDDGSLSYYQKFSFNPGGRRAAYYAFNVLNEIQNSREKINVAGINLQTSLNVKLNSYLTGSAVLAYSNNNTDDQTIYNANTFYASGLRGAEFGATAPASSLLPVGGEFNSNKVRNQSYMVRGQLSYNRPVRNRDNLNVMLGAEMSSNQYLGYQMTRRGYLPDRGEIFAPVDPSKYPIYSAWNALTNIDKVKDQLVNLASGYFSTSYSINDKYILNFNTRTDFSNKFGSRSREKFLPTWSVSGRWDISKDFFNDSKIVNLLALKASYGYQGNMLDNQTPNLIIKQGATDPITQTYYSNILYYPNPNLKWEKNGEVNLGLDFAFFKNKIQGTVNYFTKTTHNAFLPKNVSDVNGVNQYIINAGTISNQGVEVTFSFAPINNLSTGGENGGFSWRIDPQLGQVINRLISRSIITHNVGEANQNVYTNYLRGSQIIDGKSSNTFYSYKFTGLDHNTGLPTFANDDPSNAAKYNGMKLDDVIKQVMVPSGSRIPTVQGGILNVFIYKQFALSFNMAYSLGSKVRLKGLYTNYQNGVPTSRVAAPLPENNVSAEFLDRWRKPGDENNTNIPALIGGSAYSRTLSHWSSGTPYEYARLIWEMYDNSDIRVVSGDFLKIKTMNFRYTFDDALVKRWHFNKMSVMFSGMNLYTFASRRLKGQDPEQSNFNGLIQLSPRPSYSFTFDVSF